MYAQLILITCCCWEWVQKFLHEWLNLMHSGKVLNFFRKYHSIETKGNAPSKLLKTPFSRINHYQCSYLIVVITRGENWLRSTHLHFGIVCILMKFMHVMLTYLPCKIINYQNWTVEIIWNVFCSIYAVLSYPYPQPALPSVADNETTTFIYISMQNFQFEYCENLPDILPSIKWNLAGISHCKY